ncbi:hypothetical protein PFMALIP_00207 [Plasmodium falciparum MaliPS096_E11]|uniref:Uncharacterized protein n=1 Tax=Plasmodium falciparum MaliPS096_E11 TaxID=1036727 RepID=A0A024WX63_PLAFA|nr:hypothetical protein PFMALIP_00207 [Plasmodium falciparum MaliPS096_E11]
MQQDGNIQVKILKDVNPYYYKKENPYDNLEYNKYVMNVNDVEGTNIIDDKKKDLGKSKYDIFTTDSLSTTTDEVSYSYQIENKNEEKEYLRYYDKQGGIIRQDNNNNENNNNNICNNDHNNNNICNNENMLTTKKNDNTIINSNIKYLNNNNIFNTNMVPQKNHTQIFNPYDKSMRNIQLYNKAVSFLKNDGDINSKKNTHDNLMFLKNIRSKSNNNLIVNRKITNHVTNNVISGMTNKVIGGMASAVNNAHTLNAHFNKSDNVDNMRNHIPNNDNKNIVNMLNLKNMKSINDLSVLINKNKPIHHVINGTEVQQKRSLSNVQKLKTLNTFPNAKGRFSLINKMASMPNMSTTSSMNMSGLNTSSSEGLTNIINMNNINSVNNINSGLNPINNVSNISSLKLLNNNNDIKKKFNTYGKSEASENLSKNVKYIKYIQENIKYLNNLDDNKRKYSLTSINDVGCIKKKKNMNDLFLGKHDNMLRTDEIPKINLGKNILNNNKIINYNDNDKSNIINNVINKNISTDLVNDREGDMNKMNIHNREKDENNYINIGDNKIKKNQIDVVNNKVMKLDNMEDEEAMNKLSLISLYPNNNHIINNVNNVNNVNNCE